MSQHLQNPIMKLNYQKSRTFLNFKCPRLHNFIWFRLKFCISDLLIWSAFLSMWTFSELSLFEKIKLQFCYKLMSDQLCIKKTMKKTLWKWVRTNCIMLLWLVVDLYVNVLRHFIFLFYLICFRFLSSQNAPGNEGVGRINYIP